MTTPMTKVILEGPLGKQFGRKWEFAVESPNEALRMVDANAPGVFKWIRANLEKYAAYKVICKYANNRTEELDENTYVMNGKPTSIRFVPVIAGAGGGVGKVILGAVLIAVAYFLPIAAPIANAMMGMGASMVLGGIVEMLSPRPSKQDQSARTDATSYYFNGPANTTMQGVPVQLIYGRVLVGSHAISAALTVDQLM